MTATSHAIIGTVIAAKFGNPQLAIPLALISHLAADFIPHWDVATNRKKKSKRRLISDAYFDVVLGFALSLILLIFLFPKTNTSYAFLIILVSQSFDWITAPYYFFNIKLPPFTWAYHLQKLFDNELEKPWGIINQIIVIVALVVLAKIF